jgi:hypothetical protein
MSLAVEDAQERVSPARAEALSACRQEMIEQV